MSRNALGAENRVFSAEEWSLPLALVRPVIKDSIQETLILEVPLSQQLPFSLECKVGHPKRFLGRGCLLGVFFCTQDAPFDCSEDITTMKMKI